MSKLATPTFLLRYVARPSDNHPEVSSTGEAAINCWIVNPSLEEADRIAVADIEGQDWVVLERESGGVTSPEDYEDPEDDGLQYYEQAQLDEEVYVFHKSPRFSVYRMVLTLESTASSIQHHSAQVMLLNETLADDEEDDFSNLAFWSKERASLALSRANEMVNQNGYRIVTVDEEGPVDWLNTTEEMSELCDYIEDIGECLILANQDWRVERDLSSRQCLFDELASEESIGARQLIHGGHVACLHPFADELDELSALEMKPEDCPGAECYWRIHDDVIFVQVNSACAETARSPGLYIRRSERQPHFVNLVAVVPGEIVSTKDLDWATKEFLEADQKLEGLSAELRPLRE